MMMNVGMLRSGRCDYVENDIRSVVEAAGEVKVKVIILRRENFFSANLFLLDAGIHIYFNFHCPRVKSGSLDPLYLNFWIRWFCISAT